jgi:hypothetical protein
LVPFSLSREILTNFNAFGVKFFAELKKMYFMGSKVQSKAFAAQKRNLLVIKSIDQKFYAELKKVYFMGSEMQPGVMRAQKREIYISRIKKILYLM